MSHGVEGVIVSAGVVRGEEEVDVKSESDGDWGDLTYPSGVKFIGEEEGNGVRGEEERDELTDEGGEVGLNLTHVHSGSLVSCAFHQVSCLRRDHGSRY